MIFFVLSIQTLQGRIKYRNLFFSIRLKIKLKYLFKSLQKHKLLKLWLTKWPAAILVNLHTIEIMAQ